MKAVGIPTYRSAREGIVLLLVPNFFRVRAAKQAAEGRPLGKWADNQPTCRGGN